MRYIGQLENTGKDTEWIMYYCSCGSSTASASANISKPPLKTGILTAVKNIYLDLLLLLFLCLSLPKKYSFCKMKMKKTLNYKLYQCVASCGPAIVVEGQLPWVRVGPVDVM